ncbi:MAG: hypothetical protein P4L84_01685 [Isosphaeraceae bacterium]|nr:hypothetical protein [Isosphaeraceae bacterium]
MPDVITKARNLASMDVLNFAVVLHKPSGVAIPQSDHPKPVTVDGNGRHFEAI